MVTLRTGTSGFSFKEWKGVFYPSDLPDKKMLAFYCSRLATVEINNTFYRMPKPELLLGWAAQVPESFRFVLKAPQRITHREKLTGSEATVAEFVRVAGALGPRLGALLFQLPPFMKKDVARLSAFLPLLPDGVRAAFEFRHPSWFEDDTYEALRARNVALVGGDSDKAERSPPLVPTADFGYLRLRAEAYSEPELAAWKDRIFAQPWQEAYVFLKHELKGPEYAVQLAG